MRLKEVILAAAKRAGALAVVRESAWRRKRLLILCYHGVSLSDEHEWDGDMYMPASLLRSRLEVLRRGGYAVLSLDEGVRRLYEGTLPPKAVSLTFDDGTYDFYANAFPLLREFGFPATVYVPTYYTRFQRPVFDPMVSYIAWKGRTHAPIAPDGLVEGSEPLAVATAADRHASTRRLHAAARHGGFDARAKDALLRAFARRLDVDYDALLARRALHLMTPAELREVAGAGVDVQLHTHRHRMPEDAQLFRQELDTNRRELHAAVGESAPLRHFCYPSGEYRSVFLPWLQEGGVETATTCDPGIASRRSEPLKLPRFVDTTGQSETTFEAWVSGFAELLPRRTRRAALAGT